MFESPAEPAAVLLLLAGAFPVLLGLGARRAPAAHRPVLGVAALLLAGVWVALAAGPPRAASAAAVWVVGLAAVCRLPRAVRDAGRAGGLERLRLLEAAVAASADGVLVAAPAGTGLRIEYANAAFEHLTGYTVEEAIGQSPSILLGDAPAEADALAAVRAAFRDAGPTRVEVPGRRADGTRLWAEWHVVPVPDNHGRPGYRVAVLRDTTDRRRAQEELARTRDFLTALLENVPFPVAVFDAADRLRMVNPAWERAAGVPRSRALGVTPAELMPAPTAHAVLTRNAAVRAAGRPVRGARDVDTPDGPRSYLTVGFPLQGADGRAGLVGEVAVDLTHQKRAEAELARRVEEVEALIELSPVGIAVANDPHGRAVDVNRVLRDVLGLPAALDPELTPAPDRLRLRARHDGRDVPPDDLPLYRCLRTGQPEDGVELRVARPDGTERVVVNSARPLFDAAGRVRGCVSVYTDVTDRRRAEDHTREREALLRHVLDHIPCAVFWKDQNSVIVGCNDSFAHDHGAAGPAEIVGRTDHDLPFTGAEADEHVACDRLVMTTGEPMLNLEEERTTADGTRAVRLVSKVPLVGPGGAVTGVLGVYRDVTELKRLEEQFRQAQKMDAVGRLAGGIAHDFNNLLTVINGNADLLRELPPGDPDAADLVADIAGAGHRAAGLVRQLLTFSRRQPVRPEVLDVSDVVAGLAGLFRRLLGETVTVATRPAATPARVRADRGQLEQVLVNLAVNARDAMPDGGTLTIDVTAADGRVRLAVSDTGTGMTDAVRARLFEPFFTTKGPDKGTGLGLAVVHGIVQQAGGRVAVESAPGAGATVRIDLPACAEPLERARPVPPSAVTPIPSRRATVLLVEDEPGVRKYARAALEGQGFAVIEAADGEAALACLARGAPDLLVSDLKMPGFDGRELARRVRESHPRVGVVLVSGQPPDDVLAGLPGSVFVPKPYRPGDLLRAARKALAAGP